MYQSLIGVILAVGAAFAVTRAVKRDNDPKNDPDHLEGVVITKSNQGLLEEKSMKTLREYFQKRSPEDRKPMIPLLVTMACKFPKHQIKNVHTLYIYALAHQMMQHENLEGDSKTIRIAQRHIERSIQRFISDKSNNDKYLKALEDISSLSYSQDDLTIDLESYSLTIEQNNHLNSVLAGYRNRPPTNETQLPWYLYGLDLHYVKKQALKKSTYDEHFQAYNDFFTKLKDIEEATEVTTFSESQEMADMSSSRPKQPYNAIEKVTTPNDEECMRLIRLHRLVYMIDDVSESQASFDTESLDEDVSVIKADYPLRYNEYMEALKGQQRTLSQWMACSCFIRVEGWDLEVLENIQDIIKIEQMFDDDDETNFSYDNLIDLTIIALARNRRNAQFEDSQGLVVKFNEQAFEQRVGSKVFADKMEEWRYFNNIFIGLNYFEAFENIKKIRVDLSNIKDKVDLSEKAFIDVARQCFDERGLKPFSELVRPYTEDQITFYRGAKGDQFELPTLKKGDFGDQYGLKLINKELIAINTDGKKLLFQKQ